MASWTCTKLMLLNTAVEVEGGVPELSDEVINETRFGYSAVACNAAFTCVELTEVGSIPSASLVSAKAVELALKVVVLVVESAASTILLFVSTA